eukprot:g8992.t1
MSHRRDTIVRFRPPSGPPIIMPSPSPPVRRRQQHASTPASSSSRRLPARAGSVFSSPDGNTDLASRRRRARRGDGWVPPAAGLDVCSACPAISIFFDGQGRGQDTEACLRGWIILPASHAISAHLRAPLAEV